MSLIFVSRLINNSISSAYKLVHQVQLQHAVLHSRASADFGETATPNVHRNFIDLPKELFEMLSSAGPYLYRDTLLLQKVLIWWFHVLVSKTKDSGLSSQGIFFLTILRFKDSNISRK